MKTNIVKENIKRIFREKDILCFSILVAVLTVFSYRQYLFGNKLFVFFDHDSLVQTYPYYLFNARRISMGEIGAVYSFEDGLGALFSPIMISLNNWMCFFGEKNVAYLMGVCQALKVAFSGIFAYIFAKLRNGDRLTCTVVGLGYAFCGHLIIRQEYASYGLEALVIIIWLVVYEYSSAKDKVYLIPIVTWITMYYLGTLDAILWGLTFVAYIVFGRVTDDAKKVQWKKIIKQEIVFITSFWLGFGRGLIVFVKEGLASSRFATTVNNNAPSVAGFVQNHSSTAVETSMKNVGGITGVLHIISDNMEKPYGILAYILRTVGMSINGTSERYSGGIWSHLVDGGFYCGILAVLIIIYAIVKMNTRKKVMYILAYIAAGIYIMVPSLRYFMNGYGCPGFRFSALRITLLLVITLVEGMKSLRKKKSNSVFDYLAIACTWMVVTYIMIFALRTGKVVMIQYWIVSEVLISVYAITIIMYLNNKISVGVFQIIVVLAMIIEVTLVPYDYINNRKTLLKSGYEVNEETGENETAYDDGTKEAVDFIKNIDREWYRIDKDYDSVYLCDPLAQDYKGTTSYIGGLGIGDDFKYMCDKLALNMRLTDLYFGPLGDVYTSSLFGVKYILSKDDTSNTYGLKYLKNVGDIAIYQNELALPIAFVSDSSIYEDEFVNYSDMQRHELLLKSCIVGDDDEIIGNTELENKNVIFTDKLEKAKDKDVVIVGVNAPSDDTAYVYAYDDDKNKVRKGIRARNGDMVYVEYYGNISDISTSIAFPYKDLDNSELEYEYCVTNADNYYSDTVDSIRTCQSRGITVTEYDDYHIKGVIDTDVDGILVTTIPYKSPFEIKIDGEVVNKEIVNLYFMGSKISKGRHEVEFEYTSDNKVWSVYKGVLKTVTLMIIIGVIFEIISQLFEKNSRSRYNRNE